MIISISGAHGSGKSTIAQRLAEKLNWKRYYIGGLRREAAKKRGLTLAEYNELGEKDPNTDKEVDEYQKELGLNKDNFIIEGRTSWYFIPHSLKIYLDVKEDVGAKRIYKNLQEKTDRNEDNGLNTWKDVKKSMAKRLISDKIRYKKYYNINVYDKNHYDFYLDTSKLSQNEAFNQVYEFIKSYIDKT